jgi:putative transposase
VWSKKSSARSSAATATSAAPRTRPRATRNGWQQPRAVKTALGPVHVQRPKLRHAHAALCDQLFGQGVTRTNALETLVIACWVRGLSDRDVEATLAEVFGEQATISRTMVSRICQRLRAEFHAWRHRDLSPATVDYLYLDGSFFKMHPKAKAEPVLVAWGIDTDGKPCFLGLAPGAAESTHAWRALVDDLLDRGLAAPLLVVSDGGKGLCAAIETSFPASLHQRCLVHVCRNLVAKVPRHAQDQVKGGYWAIFDGIDAEGEAAVAEARRRAKRLPPSGSAWTRPRSHAWPTTSTSWWPICCFPPSTASASATPT